MFFLRQNLPTRRFIAVCSRLRPALVSFNACLVRFCSLSQQSLLPQPSDLYCWTWLPGGWRMTKMRKRNSRHCVCWWKCIRSSFRAWRYIIIYGI